MDIPRYLRVLRRYWILLLVGVVVAVASGLLSGFSVGSGGLTPRASSTYSATTTLQLSDPNLSPFASEVAPTTTTPDGRVVSDPTQRQNLAALALLYAYYAVSDEVRGRTEAAAGSFATGERVTAASRTTQPSGTEAFPGRFSLPLLDVAGFATTPERAEQLSQAGASSLIGYVQEMQEAQGVPDGSRIGVTQVRTTAPVAQDTGTVLLPVVLVTVAVLLLFVALAFVLQNVADHGGRSGGSPQGPPGGADQDRRRPAGDPGETGADDLRHAPQTPEWQPGPSTHRTGSEPRV